jgi:hypothetical protein
MILRSVFSAKKLAIFTTLISILFSFPWHSYAENPFDLLPNEVLEAVFLQVPKSDQDSLSRVNHRFRDVVRNSRQLKGQSNFAVIPYDFPGYTQPAGDIIHSVFANQGRIYLGTSHGLSISEDGGKTFRTVTPFRGLTGWIVEKIHVQGNEVCIKGMKSNEPYFSSDGGWSFSKEQEGKCKDRLGSLQFKWQKFSGGIRISSDEGIIWKEYLYNDRGGLRPRSEIRSVYVDENIVIVGAYDGYSISHDGGKSFENHFIKRTSLTGGHIDDIVFWRGGIWAKGLFEQSLLLPGSNLSHPPKGNDRRDPLELPHFSVHLDRVEDGEELIYYLKTSGRAQEKKCIFRNQVDAIHGKRTYFTPICDDHHYWDTSYLYATDDQGKIVTRIPVDPLIYQTDSRSKVTAVYSEANRVLVAVNTNRRNLLYFSDDDGKSFHRVSNRFELAGPVIRKILAHQGKVYLVSDHFVRTNLGPLRIQEP